MDRFTLHSPTTMPPPLEYAVIGEDGPTKRTRCRRVGLHSAAKSCIGKCSCSEWDEQLVPEAEFDTARRSDPIATVMQAGMPDPATLSDIIQGYDTRILQSRTIPSQASLDCFPYPAALLWWLSPWNSRHVLRPIPGLTPERLIWERPSSRCIRKIPRGLDVPIGFPPLVMD